MPPPPPPRPSAKPRSHPAGPRPKADAEQQAIQQHQALACAAALQSLWVLAGRASAEAEADSADFSDRLDALAAVLPRSLRPLWWQVCGQAPGQLPDQRPDQPPDQPPEQAGPAPLSPTAWDWLGQSWALAVGNAAANLRPPGGQPPVRWNVGHRVRPMLRSLNDGAGPTRPATDEQAAGWRVWPVAPLCDQALDAVPRADTLHFVPHPSPHQAAWQTLLADLAKDAQHHAHEGQAAWLQRTDSLLALHLRGQPAYWEGLKQAREGATMTLDTLVDQQRLAGALAAALWRFQARQADMQALRLPPGPPEHELMLVSGQLAPIQDFIFGARSDPALDSNTVLRGRSVFARLVVELACLRTCDELAVAPTAVMVASAAKFSLLCANTRSARVALRELQSRLDQWCLEHLQGTANVQLASTTLARSALESVRPSGPAGRANPTAPTFMATLAKLSARMAESKLRRFHLCTVNREDGQDPDGPWRWVPPLYLGGEPEQGGQAGAAPRCRVDARLPADPETGAGLEADTQAPTPLSAMGALQWALARGTDSETPRLWITDAHRHPRALRVRGAVNVFGFAVAATAAGPEEPDERIAAWDLGTVALDGRVPWRGRRRVPLALPALSAPPGLEGGSPLRMALKGDVDRLGAVFSQRMPGPNLARLSTLSRELEEFFTIRLLRMAWEHGAALTPILVGGDDFIFLGEPEAILRFASALQQAWAACTADGATLSIGLSLPQRVGTSSRALVEEADAALAQAKSERNAVGFAGECWPWPRWSALSRRRANLQEALRQGRLFPRVMQQLADPLQRMDSPDPATAAHATLQFQALARQLASHGQDAAPPLDGSMAHLLALDNHLGPAELLTALALADQLRPRRGQRPASRSHPSAPSRPSRSSRSADASPAARPSGTRLP